MCDENKYFRTFRFRWRCHKTYNCDVTLHTVSSFRPRFMFLIYIDNFFTIMDYKYKIDKVFIIRLNLMRKALLLLPLDLIPPTNITTIKFTKIKFKASDWWSADLKSQLGSALKHAIALDNNSQSSVLTRHFRRSRMSGILFRLFFSVFECLILVQMFVIAGTSESINSIFTLGVLKIIKSASWQAFLSKAFFISNWYDNRTGSSQKPQSWIMIVISMR